MKDKVYELSISKNYVSNWDTKDAIREILQNAIDESTKGNEMYINYVDDVLTIGNKYSKIKESELVLGNSSKKNDVNSIGSFGEGFKLALVVLLRNSHKVEIKNCDKLWTPYFDFSKNFNIEVLKIASENLTDFTNLEFNISGIDNYLYYELLNRFPCINNEFGVTVETAYGQILLSKEFKGKMFVEGLYIQEDESFEFGYNFKASEVNLDRDRKAINYYHLKALTAKSALTAEVCDDIIYSKIVKGRNNDTSSIKDYVEYMDDDFAKEFISKFYSENELDEETIVATPEVCKELGKEGYRTYVSNENVSTILNSDSEKEKLIEEARARIKKKDDILESWEDFETSWLRKALLFMYKVYSKLSLNEQDCLRELILENENKDYSFDKISQNVLTHLPQSLEDEYIQNKKMEIEGE